MPNIATTKMKAKKMFEWISKSNLSITSLWYFFHQRISSASDISGEAVSGSDFGVGPFGGPKCNVESLGSRDDEDLFFWIWVTLPETNIAPENRPSQ